MRRLLLVGLSVVLSLGATADPSRSTEERVLLIRIDDAITPVSADFILEGIQDAEHGDYAALVIELDTPGGLDASMRVAVKAILACEIPVVVWVGPPGARAASAGMFLTLAAHVAAMAHGTSIGAAHPVGIGGGPPDSIMNSKVVNDAASYARSLATARGRNADWAEDAVRRSVSAGAEDALAKGIIDLLADDEDELLHALEGRAVASIHGPDTLHTAGAVIRHHEMGFVERLLAIIANPNVAYLLFLAGILGLFFELSNPGAILPGVIGGISLILALFAFQTLPVNSAGVILILLALVLFIVEVKVMSHGILAIGGVVSLLLGSMMLFRDVDGGWPRISWLVVIPALTITAGFFLLAVTLAIRAQKRRTVTGREGMIGEIGVVLQTVSGRDGGRIRLRGEIWDARCRETIPAGERVKVASIEGLVVVVDPLKDDTTV